MIYEYVEKETILDVKDLCLSFDGKPILENINLTIKDVVRPGVITGQVGALLGPSGIGKTQLFRCLAGLQRPTSGTILVTEKHIPVHVGLIGVVAQSYPLFKRRSVISNLIVAAELRGHRGNAAKEKAMEALAIYDLTDKAHFYPCQLSGGQRQRVAIAQQILSSDHFILMDEPFSGLDPVMKDKACDAILKLAMLDELNTVIVVTHDISSAVAISDTIWLMGKPDPTKGANIVKEYNLMKRGLAWQPDIHKMPEFQETVVEIRNDFGI